MLSFHYFSELLINWEHELNDNDILSLVAVLRVKPENNFVRSERSTFFPY